MGEVILDIKSEMKVLDEQAVLVEALKLMVQEEDLGRGFTSDGNRRVHHYSWLTSAVPETWETGFDALRAWRFPVRDEEEEVWTKFDFTGQKTGQERLLFDRIQPYMEGYVKMSTDYGRTIEFDFDQNS